MYKTISAYIAGILGILFLLFGSFRLFQYYIAGGTDNLSQGLAATTTAAAQNRTGSPVVIGPTTNATVAAVVLALPGVAKFQAIFIESGLASSTALKGKGSYTIFVPTDSAFDNLPEGTLDHLTPAEVLRLMEYHIMKGKPFDLKMATSTTATALSGDPLMITIGSGGGLQVNNASGIESFTGKNGIVYTISAVLLPPARQ